MNRIKLRSVAPIAAAVTLGLGLAACGAGNEDGSDSSGGDSVSGTLNGAGASSQESAVQAWRSGFQEANPDATVNYDPVGSGGGREQFLAGGVAFAGSDAFLSEDELTEAQERCGGDIVEVPVYVSPIAVIYNLPGLEQLNLTPETLGGIFAGEITEWDDPAIAESNPDADLPSSTITPVHRSDASGTTENFTDYLDATSGGTWDEGVVEEWPIDGGEAAEQTSGVVSAVTNGEGTIGYADASQAGDLGTAAVQVGDEFVEYSPEAAAAVLDASDAAEGRAETDIAIEVDRAIDTEGVYPIVLASYMMACQTYDDAEEADLVKAFLSYVVSEDGQKTAADNAGSAPLSSEFSDQATTAIETISGS
ncbi:phosphate ABC transporter substrate-binding protein PstS [Aeromicrobium sp. CTD01-1L150]|uniref:phosphate ABC transporter substrate-binding protein PstS n=1 Tax=Aeromicrobium sp. CTD01-1L150 TaxID=3341830 RepID=UPI0035C0CEA0